MDLINIRLATIEDLDNINLLFNEVIEDLKKVKNINMWDEVYPFCEFENDINNNEMYIIEKENKIIGSFALSEDDNEEYHTIKWTNNKKFFYINRLVISPIVQGKGYAKFTMDYIDNYAINNNFNSIRLTVFKDNISAINLYKKFNFIEIENSNLIIENKSFLGFEKTFN